jgi:methylenetetrahydrofolate dehydrogenase (NADP+)/methenyltetrahydrofolate cyclohydrolase
MSLELLLEGATVTICHRFTNNLAQLVAIADLVVVATGVMDVVHTDWLKEHQVVIDVGIHRLADGSIRGDVDFSKAKERVSWITPVPGGVGPMTIVSLLKNTLKAANVA